MNTQQNIGRKAGKSRARDEGGIEAVRRPPVKREQPSQERMEESDTLREIFACRRRMIGSIAALGLFALWMTACSSNPLQPGEDEEIDPSPSAEQAAAAIAASGGWPEPSPVGWFTLAKERVPDKVRPRLGRRDLEAGVELHPPLDGPPDAATPRDKGMDGGGRQTRATGDGLAPRRIVQRRPLDEDRRPTYWRTLSVDPRIVHETDQ